MQDVADLRQVVGGNLRRLREQQGASQDEVARQLRLAGVRWTRSVVAAAEAGTKTVDLDELVILAMVLCNGNVPDLLAGNGTVQLAGATTMRLDDVRSVLTGRTYTVSGVDTPTSGGMRMRARAYADGEAEHKAARRLGCTLDAVNAAASRLWRRSLTEERDRIVNERAEDGAPARTIQAIRGHVTRELFEQLKAEVTRGAAHGGRNAPRGEH